jgi:2-dehydro-3-deoxygalactonokinase
MRGEEMAVFGIEGTLPSRVVLPGAHSKWIRTDGTRILDVATYMSGEVLNLLRRDSLVSRLIPESHEPRPAAFERGVLMAQDKAALPGGVLQRIFSARSLVLFDRLQPEEIADYLAGVILGSEIAEAFAGTKPPSTVHVLGQTPIATSYRNALKLLGIESPVVDSNAARGFGRLVLALAP